MQISVLEIHLKTQIFNVYESREGREDDRLEKFKEGGNLNLRKNTC